MKKYFTELTDVQIEQYRALDALYRDWNSKINVISRKGIDQLYTEHVLHSLAIAKVCQFSAGAKILDVGCGGGFPGIPLAIMFPECEFMMVDSIGKKIKVVNEVAYSLGLTNVIAQQIRAEQVTQKFDFVVSRAVADMSEFVGWTWDKIAKGNKAGTLPNGILYLKGGDLTDELTQTGKAYQIFNVSDYFEDEFFETKKIVFIKK